MYRAGGQIIKGATLIRIERAREIAEIVAEIGVDAAAEKLHISRESVRRAVRQAKGGNGEPVEKQDSLIKKILSRYSPEELRALAAGGGINPSAFRRPALNFSGEKIVIGFCTDTHIGEESFVDELWIAFIKECKAAGASLIMHAGDLHEGMSNRPDQIYHLTDIGASAQMDHAERLLSMTDIPIKVIDGNHDRWAVKANGLFMVRDLAKRLPHVEFLGCDSGEVTINGTRWMLWHGEDGSSYATSYRLQKLAESFTGGDKPAVLLAGHTHKQGFFFPRNIHMVSGGALSYQSAWMKSTKKGCDTGFWIIEATIRDNQIVRFKPEWLPIYS